MVDTNDGPPNWEGFGIRDVKAHCIIDVFTNVRIDDGSVNRFHEALDYVRSRGTDLIVIKIAEGVDYFDASAMSAVLAARVKMEGVSFRFCGNRKPVLDCAGFYRLRAALETEETYQIFSCVACKRPRECRYREADQTLDSLVPSEESSIS